MSKRHRPRLALLLMTSLAAAPIVHAQLRVGTEFQVNAITSGVQSLPDLDLDGEGDFVVVWRSGQAQDGNLYGVFGRRFNSSGVAQGGELQINVFFTGDQFNQAVALDGDGDFVVTWQSYGQDGDEWSVFAQRFSSAGVRQGGEFQVNTYTPGDQSTPAVARETNGDFVIVWQETSTDGTGYGVRAQRFDAGGVRQAGEFQVNTYTSSNQSFASVAMEGDGDFVVAWNSFGQDGFGNGIFAKRFSSAGTALAGEFQVNSYTSDSQIYPSVAVDADGDFVVAWQSNGQDGSGEGVFARRFNAAGAAQGGDLEVATYLTSNQSDPVAAMEADGDFTIAWHSIGQDGSSTALIGRSFDAAGVAQTAEVVVNTHTALGQQYGAVAMDSDGDFVIAWQSSHDGNGIGIFAQRFITPATLDIDLDLTTAPLTDGLLVLRHLFGFSGPALVNAAIGPNCDRCDSGAVKSYLSALTVLDIDGSGGPAQPLTDGLLVLRFLFGFSGASLTAGALDAACTRCQPAEIAAYLAPLV